MLQFELPNDPRTAAIIAAKFRAALDHAPNLRASAIARACSVSAQAVSGWQRTGRIDKRHIPKLAAMTGTSLDWWMDGLAISPPVPADRSSPASRAQMVQEPLPVYGTPQDTRLLHAFQRLTESDRERFIREIEDLAATTDAIRAELQDVDSAAQAAFGPAVSDRDVEKRMKLAHHRTRR
jgi:hypothetical protein